MELKERLKQVLEGNGGNYIFPFFWQHGEEESVLRDYMRAIREANIREVCVESRPHPDFGAGLVAGYGYHSGRGGKTRDAGLDSG